MRKEGEERREGDREFMKSWELMQNVGKGGRRAMLGTPVWFSFYGNKKRSNQSKLY